MRRRAARRNVRDLPGIIASLSERLKNFMVDQAAVAENDGDMITIGTRTCSHESAAGVLADLLESVTRNV